MIDVVDTWDRLSIFRNSDNGMMQTIVTTTITIVLEMKNSLVRRTENLTKMKKEPHGIADAYVEQTGNDLWTQIANDNIVCDARAEQISDHTQFNQ